jgi:prepilin-type N-terminal cleavage/methylation domain-containing protein
VRRSGLTLLETMVALVILGLVAVGFLAVFQGSTRLAREAERWSEAVAYAEDAMEAGKLDPRELLAPTRVDLGGGF